MKKIVLILVGFLFTFNSYAQTRYVNSTINFRDYFGDIRTSVDTTLYSEFRVEYNSKTYDFGESFIPAEEFSSSSDYSIKLTAKKSYYKTGDLIISSVYQAVAIVVIPDSTSNTVTTATTVCATSTIWLSYQFPLSYNNGVVTEYSNLRVKYGYNTVRDWGDSFVPKEKITTTSSDYDIKLMASLSSYQLILKASKKMYDIYGKVISSGEVEKTITIINNSQAVLGDLPTGKTTSDASFTLTQGSPSGGTYSGTGVSGGRFYPASAGVGTHPITYTVSSGDCSTSASKTITVTQGLQTKSPITVPSVCQNGASINLLAYTGGTFSGRGVNGTNFVPATASVGTHTITNSEVGYNDITFTITVLASPTVTLGAFPTDKYIDDASFTLTQGSPAGGTYSGTGVSGTSFDPAAAGAGIHTITYSYTNGSGCTETATGSITVKPKNPDEEIPDKKFCVGAGAITLSDGRPTGGTYRVNGVISTTFNPGIAGIYNITYDVLHYEQASAVYTVNALPAVTLSAIDPICSSTASVNLDGKQNPAGGTFSGTGVSGTTFTTATAGVGAHTVNYTYADANGCTNTAAQDITVNALPNVTLAAFDDICKDGETLTLSYGSPSSTTSRYYVNNVIKTEFDPDDYNAGTHTIKYEYADGNGCKNTASQNITVNNLPDVSLEAFSAVCVDAGSFELSGGNPSGGTYSGTGVSNGEFYPNVAGAGTHIITYSYSDGSCENIAAQNIVVNALPNNVKLEAFDDVCLNNGLVTLSGGSPTVGTYKYEVNGVEATTFNPETVGTYAITYEYTDGNGCTNTADQNITVNDLPKVNFTVLPEKCVNASSFQLKQGTPVTGIYSGSGVIDGYFYPDEAGVNTHTLTYQHTDANGCTNTATQNITINDTTSINFPALDGICENAEVLDLDTIVTPRGGEYSGNGISETIFYPDIADIGTNTIGYTYKNDKGCVNYKEKNITVFEKPVVLISTFGSYCENVPEFELTGGLPIGGIYSGNGVVNNKFTAKNAGVGTHTITYTFANENGCSEMAQTTITVLESAFVNITPFDDICENAEPIKLSLINLEDGYYTGNGVENGKFDPSIGVGTYPITYTYSNENGCVDSDTEDITVLKAPGVELTELLPICENAEPLALYGGTPEDGGVYSNEFVIDNNFYAGVAKAGLHPITYTYTNQYGCSVSVEKNIEVFELPTVTLPEFEDICQNAEPLLLSDGLPAGGIYYFDNEITVTLNPKNYIPGAHVIKYEVTNSSGCTEFVEKTIKILPSPTIHMDEIADICQNAGIVQLNHAYPTGGTYFINESEATSIDPSLYGAGVYSAKYTYVNNYGCSESKTDNFSILPKPNVDLIIADQICENDQPLALNGGLPQGGEYTGYGVSNDIFEPVGAGEYTIRYTVTNADKCGDYVEKTVTVNPVTDVKLQCIDDICQDAESFTLTDGYPENGYYTMENQTITSFNPIDHEAGEYTITYTFENENGCSNIDSRTFSVLSVPEINLPDFGKLCYDIEVLELSEATPLGGEYKGEFVAGGKFYSRLSGVGIHDINYTVTNGQGCTVTETGQIEALPEMPDVTLPELASICQNSEPFILDGGIPIGGKYYVDGIEKVEFVPADYLAGDHIIKYLYTDVNGCQKFTEANIFLDQTPVVELLDFVPVCQNAGIISLAGGSPAGGTYYVDGIVQTEFNPSLYAVGTHVVTYEHTDGNVCTSIAENTIQVLSVTIAKLSVADICQNAEPVTLDGGSPEGGYYSIDGEIITSLNPADYIVGLYTATYTFENENGCIDAATSNFKILESPTVSIGTFGDVCQSEEPFDLSGGLPEGRDGKYYINSVEVVTFNPRDYAPGVHTVTYEYQLKNGCSSSAETTINILAAPNATLQVIADICQDAEPLTLSGGLPTGGYYSTGGQTITSFNPADYVIGTQTVNYTCESENGCVSVTESIFELLESPIVTIGTFADICQSDKTLRLTGGLPKGGEYYINGVQITKLNPQDYVPGVYTIVYEYQLRNGCGSSAETTINVLVVPTVTLKNIGDLYEDNTPIILSGGSPEGGYYSIDGEKITSFNPANHITGKKTITYTCEDDKGCINIAKSDFKILKSPKPNKKEEKEEKNAGFEDIYPNPSSDGINIQPEAEMFEDAEYDKVMIRVLSLQGDLITAHQETFQENMNVDISGLNKGMYIIQIVDLNTNETILRQKIMKK